MSFRYLGAVISKTPPTVTAPVDGEGGSASGAWSIASQANYQALGTWPKPLLFGQLWSWGLNNTGQVGDGTLTNRSSPVQLGALTTWIRIAGGRRQGIAVKTDGTLWTWGDGFAGQLGLGNTTSYSSPMQVGALTTWYNIAGNNSFTLATKTDGTLS